MPQRIRTHTAVLQLGMEVACLRTVLQILVTSQSLAFEPGHALLRFMESLVDFLRSPPNVASYLIHILYASCTKQNSSCPSCRDR